MGADKAPITFNVEVETMSELILPNRELVIPSRRGFIRGTATTLAALFVAPSIVPAANLMDINTKQNRLVFAYRRAYIGDNHFAYNYYPSMLNLGDAYDPAIREMWAAENIHFKYDLIRWADVLPQNQKKYGGLEVHSRDLKRATKGIEEKVERYRREIARRRLSA